MPRNCKVSRKTYLLSFAKKASVCMYGKHGRRRTSHTSLKSCFSFETESRRFFIDTTHNC